MPHFFSLKKLAPAFALSLGGLAAISLIIPRLLPFFSTEVPASIVVIEKTNPFLFGSPSCGQSSVNGPARVFHWPSTQYSPWLRSAFSASQPLTAMPSQDGLLVNLTVSMAVQYTQPAPFACGDLHSDWLSSYVSSDLASSARKLTLQHPRHSILSNPDTISQLERQLSESVQASLHSQNIPVKLLQLNLRSISSSPR